MLNSWREGNFVNKISLLKTFCIVPEEEKPKKGLEYRILRRNSSYIKVMWEMEKGLGSILRKMYTDNKPLKTIFCPSKTAQLTKSALQDKMLWKKEVTSVRKKEVTK